MNLKVLPHELRIGIQKVFYLLEQDVGISLLSFSCSVGLFRGGGELIEEGGRLLDLLPDNPLLKAEDEVLQRT
jgi:hypothetical protein